MSFKVRLLLGAAAPFVLALPAAAQVSISTATTTPITTGTANNGQASDVVITNTGNIIPTGPDGVSLITVNSNNTVTNSGSLQTNNVNNATGVRLQAGRTGSYSGAGGISLVEDYTRTDTDNDGDLDGPLAQGTGRTAVLVEPGGTFTGNISLLANGSFIVEGNNSAGVSIRSILAGNYFQKGAISVIGDNALGVDVRQNVTGNVQVGGSVVVTGKNAAAVNILGDIGGEFLIDGNISSTGFTSTTVSNYADPDLLTSTDTPIAQRRDADDLFDNTGAVVVRGNLARGFLIQGTAVGGTDPTTDVKDVVQNFNENRTTANINSFGSGPAVLVQPLDGAAGRDIRLQKVRESVRDTLDDDKDSNFDEIIGTFDYDYGFIHRGVISASGFNIGFAGTGVRIAGSADGTHTTTIDGGIFNGGTITASGYEANAFGYDIGRGAVTPQFINSSAIAAIVNTETTHQAVAVNIGAGASVPVVTNNGAIVANTRGYNGDAIAIRDLSGTVTSFTNTSRITASFTDDNTADTITSGLGRAIALDLSHSNSNITVTQSDTVDNARMFGDVLLGAGNDKFNLSSGFVVGNVDFGTGSDTFAIDSAQLTGNAAFKGTGANLALTNGGIMVGDLSLNGAGGALSFASGSAYQGKITRTSNTSPLTMSINNATVNSLGASTLQLTSLQAANAAKIGFAINNARLTSTQPIFNITGTADIAANTTFTPIFEQFSRTGATVRVLNAGTLNLGGPAANMLNANAPYLYNVNLQRATNANALDLVLRVKTPAEIGLSTRQASAFDGVLSLLEGNDTVAAAITAINNKGEFTRAVSDLLPGPDASVLQVLASNATAAFGATAHRLDLISDKPDAPGGAWTEEFGVYHSADANNNALGLFGGGFGVAAGLDLIASRNWVLGGYVALESLELEERGRTAAPVSVAQTTFGGYGGLRLGQLAFNANASYGTANFDSDREVRLGAISDRIKASWNATTTSAALRATYNVPLFDFVDLVPYAGVDYISVDQDAYRENGSVDALEIIADKSKSNLSTASYGMSLVGTFGSQGGSFTMHPELSLGYRSILSSDSPEAAIRFAGAPAASSAFRLDAGHAPEDAVVAGLGLNVRGQFVNMKFGYDAEISDSQITHYGSITFRLAFW